LREDSEVSEGSQYLDHAPRITAFPLTRSSSRPRTDDDSALTAVGATRALLFPRAPGKDARSPSGCGADQITTRTALHAALYHRLVLDQYAPAAVLTDYRHNCLVSVGPIGRYLELAVGCPNDDLLSVSRPEVRLTLETALQRVAVEKNRVVVTGGEILFDAAAVAFSISVEPVAIDGEDLLLVCFVEESKPEARRRSRTPTTREGPRIRELKQALEDIQKELRNAIHALEASNEEQRGINEEARSVNAEFQATNEALLASREELQLLNEELTALNAQIQETLAWRLKAAAHLDTLTVRQREVMVMVLAGHPNKNIAADLHISQRTVENHRASIMKRTGSKSLPALARLASAAGADRVAASPA
jgi:DNA-binding CsgD family transcriptional regulator